MANKSKTECLESAKICDVKLEGQPEDDKILGAVMSTNVTSRPGCEIPPMAVSVPIAAAACGISERQMWRLIKSGDLSTRKMGKRTLILYRDLQAYIYELPVSP